METFDNMLKRKCKKFLTRCGDIRNEENKSNVLANRVIIRAGTSNTERREFNCVQELDYRQGVLLGIEWS